VPSIVFVQADTVRTAGAIGAAEAEARFGSLPPGADERIKMVAVVPVFSPLAQRGLLDESHVLGLPDAAARRLYDAYVHADDPTRTARFTVADVRAHAQLEFALLERAAWWNDRPPRWRRLCAWLLELAMLVALLVVLFLYATLASGRLASAGAWTEQVLYALGYSSLFKIGVTEPVLFLAITAIKRLFVRMPAELRDYLLEVLIEPLAG
jgi:hypothetical protein